MDPVRLLRNPPDVHHCSRGSARTWQISSVAACCFLFGCLPLGDPPAGQHVIADRTLTGVYLSPSEQDGVPSSLLVTGLAREFPAGSVYASSALASVSTLSDLYAVPYVGISSMTTDIAGLQPLVSDFLVSSRSLIAGTIPTDSLGRLLFVQYVSTTDSLQNKRVDLATGSTDALGPAYIMLNGQFFVLSPARSRVYSGGLEDGVLCDLDACQALNYVPSDFTYVSNSFAFVGEDFYYTDQLSGASGVLGGNLNRLRPQAQPEVLLSFTGVVSFQPILGDHTPQLLLSLATDSGDAPFALLDTDTLETSSLPAEKGQAQFMSASSDGHWLAFLTTIPASDPAQPDDHRLFLYDWTTGSYATVDSAHVGQAIGSSIEWRPGHDELWFRTLPDGFGIWRPDAELTTARATLYPSILLPDIKLSAFTRDGRHWFSMQAGHRSASPAYVGLADNPTAPGLALNPRGTSTGEYWETDDGRLLVGAWTVDVNRNDIYLVDADAGTSRAIASTGHLVALGHTRALALLNWETSRQSGDLTLVDLASGAQTVLARDVYAVAVDRGRSADVPPGSDALAPGTRVAYLTNNRLASPWDGLWVALLP
jgi:hypothetical protein